MGDKLLPDLYFLHSWLSPVASFSKIAVTRFMQNSEVILGRLIHQATKPMRCRCDGPLLSAIRSGAWVLLDELNLAGQSILEGLNAVLDHRAEVFIPELGSTFQCHPNFRLFAAQNPLQEGGGRKGLPKSFLNRFTRVHVELLLAEDLMFIAGTWPALTQCPLLLAARYSLPHCISSTAQGYFDITVRWFAFTNCSVG